MKLARLATIAALLLLSSTARADDAQNARTVYEQGQRLYEAGNYKEAADAFQKAYALSGKKQLLWDVAASLRRQFNIDHDIAGLRRARSVYENFARVSTNPTDQDDARHEIENLDGIIGAVEAAGAGAPAPTAKSAEPAFEPVPDLPAMPTPAAPTVAPTPAPVAPAPTPAPAAAVTAPVAPAPATSTPVYKKWWLWTGVAVVVVAAASIGAAYAIPDNPAVPSTGAGNHVVSF